MQKPNKQTHKQQKNANLPDFLASLHSLEYFRSMPPHRNSGFWTV